MTKSFLTLKAYKLLGAKKGNLLLQEEQSAQELKMSELVEQGYFKELTEEESLAIYKSQN
jgi:hypothetical protein